MDRTDELLDILNLLILTSIDNTITIDKATLIDVLTCLQYSQDTIEILQNQLQHDQSKKRNQHYELVLVQKNLLFEFGYDSYQLSVQDQFNETMTYVEYKGHHEHVQHNLSKLDIQPWEEVQFKRK